MRQKKNLKLVFILKIKIIKKIHLNNLGKDKWIYFRQKSFKVTEKNSSLLKINFSAKIFFLLKEKKLEYQVKKYIY